MNKNLVTNAIIGMGFGFPITLLCMTLIGGFNEVILEFLIWMVASALYGILSGVLFSAKIDLPFPAVLGLHFLGCSGITVAAALLCGYIRSLADILPVMIPAILIYAGVYGIVMILMKQNEKKVNRALEDK